jgi:hypothetical protein
LQRTNPATPQQIRTLQPCLKSSTAATALHELYAAIRHPQQPARNQHVLYWARIHSHRHRTVNHAEVVKALQDVIDNQPGWNLNPSQSMREAGWLIVD